MNWIEQRNTDAAEKVRASLALPMPESSDMMGVAGDFDPWEIFPAVYGSYDSAFDKCAIEVLCEIRDGNRRRDDLAADIIREMLCVADLCEYGTSPRVCFPTTQFRELLPALIAKWHQRAEMAWGEPVTDQR